MCYYPQSNFPWLQHWKGDCSTLFQKFCFTVSTKFTLKNWFLTAWQFKVHKTVICINLYLFFIVQPSSLIPLYKLLAQYLEAKLTSPSPLQPTETLCKEKSYRSLLLYFFYNNLMAESWFCTVLSDRQKIEDGSVTVWFPDHLSTRYRLSADF